MNIQASGLITIESIEEHLRSLKLTSRLEGITLKVFPHLENLGFIFEKVDESFHHNQGERGIRLCSIKGGYDACSLDLRCALIFSSKIDIINMMIYPADGMNIPVFAVEYIVFGNLPRVAVVDLQPVQGKGTLRDSVNAYLKEVHCKYVSRLTHGGELPHWALEHFTESCIYSRPQNPNEWETLEDSLMDYLEVWFKQFCGKPNTQKSFTDLVNQYKQHHVTHTPGRKFLAQAFGSDWSENYLRSFIYPLH